MLLCPYFLPERGSEASLSYKATMASNITTTPNSANNKRTVGIPSNSDILLNDGLGGTSSVIDNGLSEEQKEQIRFSQVGRKKDFVHMGNRRMCLKVSSFILKSSILRSRRILLNAFIIYNVWAKRGNLAVRLLKT